MTVSTEVSREEYTGNGVTTDFDYRFRVFSADELVVTVADTTENIRTLVMNTDYTVSGAGSRNGGKVKLASALASNWRISIERELPVTQETDVRNQGNFFPEVHEDAWDKLTMLIQQVFSWLGLALRKPNWLAKYYDAKGNRISNLGDPASPQDAAPKSYVDLTYQYGKGYTDDQLKRTLRSPAGEVLNQLPAASVRRGKFQAYDTQNGQPILVNPEKTPSDVWIKLGSINGYSYIGGFFSQETSGAYGNGFYDLVSWRGERGQFDQTQGIATQVTGAGVSFGGIHNRGMVVVGPGGALFSQLMLEGRPYSDIVASAYTIDANRLDAFGREVQVVKFPTKNNPTDNQGFELELYSDVNGQPKGVIRNQEKRTDLDNTGTTGDRALFIADEKLFATSSKFFAKIRIPDEVNRFSLDPIFGYRNFSSLTASNVLHIAVQSRFIYEITSMINSGNFYCYLSFRCRTNSNGNDTSKYGLYELAGNAQFAGGTVDGNAMYLHIANFLKDPDGKAANGANSPGTSSSTVCNYTDYQLYVCSEKLTPGTGLSDRYNGFLTNLSYGPVQTKAIRDVVSGYRPYTPTTVVTSINNGAAVTSTINAYNEGFISRLDYDMSIRNDVNTLTVPFSTALGDYSGYDFAMRIFNRFGLKGYTV